MSLVPILVPDPSSGLPPITSHGDHHILNWPPAMHNPASPLSYSTHGIALKHNGLPDTCLILQQFSVALKRMHFAVFFRLFFSWDWISLCSPGNPWTLNSDWVIQRLRIQACIITFQIEIHSFDIIALASFSPVSTSHQKSRGRTQGSGNSCFLCFPSNAFCSTHTQYICRPLFSLQDLPKTTNLLTLSVMASFPISPHHNAYI